MDSLGQFIKTMSYSLQKFVFLKEASPIRRVWPRFNPAPRHGSVRPSDLWQLFLDVVAVAVVAMESYRIIHDAGADVVALVLLVMAFLLTALRRYTPTLALTAAAVMTVVLPLQTGQSLPAWCLLQVCLLSFAILKSRSHVITAMPIIGVILIVESVFLLKNPLLDPLTFALVAWTAAAGGIGSAVRSHRGYVRALEERSESLLATREAIVARNLAEERMRIARELHDVMAHHIASINLHAGAAEANLHMGTKIASQSLVHIRTASSEVLNELQAILHVLRSDEPETETGDPIPGIEQIPQLFEAFRALDPGLLYRPEDLAGLPSELSPAVGSALYRILQEALTNVHKHGTGGAKLDIKIINRNIHVKICNPTVTEKSSTAPKQSPHLSGFGLTGMHERAASTGGMLRVTSEPGNFALEAVLPLGMPK